MSDTRPGAKGGSRSDGSVLKTPCGVIPAKAGIQYSAESGAYWIPAFAGMTAESSWRSYIRPGTAVVVDLFAEAREGWRLPCGGLHPDGRLFQRLLSGGAARTRSRFG